MNKEKRNKSILRSLVLASTVIGVYAMPLGKILVYSIFRRAYQPESTETLRVVIPQITLFMLDYYWMPMIVILALGLFSTISSFLPRIKEKSDVIMVTAVWAHLLIAWLVAFCFCYNGFTGAMCLHHGPEFEMEQFIRCAYGFFPVSFLALLLMPYCLISSYIKRKIHNQSLHINGDSAAAPSP